MDFVMEVLGALVKSSPAFAVLIAWLISTLKDKTKLEAEVKELSTQLRKTEKENTETLLKVNEVLEEVVEDSNANSKDILTEIKHIKDIVMTKLLK